MAKQETTTSIKYWKGIITAVDSPIRLFALVALIFNGVMVFFAYRTKSEDSKTLFIISLVAFVVLFIAIIFALSDKRMKVPEIGGVEPDSKMMRYDFFVAAPMASMANNAEYQAGRNKILEVIKTIKTECGLETFFYAGENIETIEQFETEDISVQLDMKAIQNSKYFVLLNFSKMEKPSSTILEAGIALALGKKSLYFGPHKNFPFLMKQADQAFRHVKIYEANNYEDVTRILKNNGEKLLNLGQPTSQSLGSV
jgi:hypothetical protein